ncbi:hypothetical protein EMIT0194MI4_20623 [Pseudomonas sp. IT-194MI4]
MILAHDLTPDSDSVFARSTQPGFSPDSPLKASWALIHINSLWASLKVPTWERIVHNGVVEMPTGWSMARVCL